MRPFTNDAGSADRPYDLARDGTLILGVQDAAADPRPDETIDVVANWFSEFRSRVGR